MMAVPLLCHHPGVTREAALQATLLSVGTNPLLGGAPHGQPCASRDCPPSLAAGPSEDPFQAMWQGRGDVLVTLIRHRQNRELA